MSSYYSNRQVRARMMEFLGGNSVETLTAVYLTAGDTEASRHREPRLLQDLPRLWDEERDIGRSLWDRESLVLDLDIECVNFDSPAEAYLHPERVFGLQQPVERCVQAILLDYGITPLHLLSGRGHHFLWRIEKRSEAFRQLAGLGRVSTALAHLYRQPHRPHGEPLPPELAAAFAGAGLLIEYVAHRIQEEAAPMCEVPVELTAIEVGPTKFGREMVSIDISEYGDPLTTRVVRVPFSLYLKPQQQRRLFGERVAARLPPVFCIPLREMDSRQGLAVMHDIHKVRDMARWASVKIPEQSQAMKLLLNAYERSALRRFHDWFYSEEHEPPERWPGTYDRLALDSLPCCVRRVIERPNDLLLRPANIRRVVRVLLALGWHPRHIAGLLRSKFERDYGWGAAWKGYDPGMRADFYVRMFAGLFAAGRDDLVDLNCQSARESGLCYASHCSFNLEQYKKSLLDRRKYERLASRPFHGLFFSEEPLGVSGADSAERLQHA